MYPGLDGGKALVEFETGLIQAQLQLENSFTQIARSTGRPTVVILDRGLLDVGAYLPPKVRPPKPPLPSTRPACGAAPPAPAAAGVDGRHPEGEWHDGGLHRGASRDLSAPHTLGRV